MKKFINRLLHKTGYHISRLNEGMKMETGKLIQKNQKISGIEYTLPEKSVFFGYHDKTPFSRDGQKILASVTDADGTDPDSECSTMDVGYFPQGKSNEFIEIGETDLWSWQQGCMLQWNPEKPYDEIVWNKVSDNQYTAVFFSLADQKIVRTLNRPVYSMDPQRSYASSLNFYRLSCYRPGYGYKLIKDSSASHPAPDNDGLFLINLKNNREELIVSLKELSSFTEEGMHHYINHITFSQDGKYLSFFHIYGDQNQKRMIRFWLYDIENKKLELLESDNMVSHYCWGIHSIFTSEYTEFGVEYFLYDMTTRSKTKIDLPNIGDIHPMFHPKHPHLIVADTKPVKNRNQHLFIFNIETTGCRYVGSFHSPSVFSDEVRCDLHPRWNRDGTEIIVDTAEGGKRKMVSIQVSDLLI